MTLFQSADRQPLNHNHYHNPSLIEQLHDDPEPFEQDTLPSYSANPEEILMAKEALLHEYTWNDHISSFFEQEINEEADGIFEAIAPTTTNLKKTHRWVKHLVQGTTLIRRRA